MRASLDTNVIIHFYRAKLEHILFDFFKDGVVIYEQIRNIELEHHGQDILNKVDGNHVLMDELISVFELGQDEYEFYGNLMQRLNNRIDILAMQNVEGTDKQLIDYKAMRDKLTKYASQYGIDKTVTMIGKWIMGEGQL